MIDAEIFFFNLIYSSLINKFENIYVTGEIIPIPKSFPAVSVVQISNNTYEKSKDYNLENHVDSIYEVNIFSDLIIGKKNQCKNIFQIIDNIFISYRFKRIMYSPINNLFDDSIYRIIGRWRGVHNEEFVYDR